MKPPRWLWRALFILVLFPLMTSMALANMASGLMFPAIIHLLFLNVLIGLIEASFVRKAFKKSPRNGIIILGNYVSALVGLVLLGLAGLASGANDFSTIAIAMAVLFGGSVLIEWPFFALALKEEMWGFSRTTFKYTFWAQSVSYAFMIPYYFLATTFFMVMEGTGPFPFEVYATIDLQNFAAQAYQHRLRPLSMGGGGKHYSGYSIPESLAVTRYGSYTAAVSKDSIVFRAISADDRNLAISVVLYPTGKLRSWEFSLEPQGLTDLDPITSAFGLLADNARKYRRQPTSEGGGGDSFDGFSIPKDLWILKYRSYTAAVSRDSIVFTAMVKDSARVIASAVLDSTGRLHSWKWMGEIL